MSRETAQGRVSSSSWTLPGFGCGVLVLVAAIQVSLASAEEKVLQLIQQSGAQVSVAYRTLDGTQEMFIELDRPFHAASTMKVPVMIELFNQVKLGYVSMEEPLEIRNEFVSIVDGSPFQLSAADDSDPELYGAVGESRSLRQLCESMITMSSNLATNLLVEKLGVEDIRRTVADLGGEGMGVLRCLEDSKAFDAGMNNTTTARGFFELLWQIANLNAVDSESSERMIEILKAQKLNEAIPSGLPGGIEVAHKTGQIVGIHHDGGIIYGPRPFVLVVLVEGLTEGDRSAQLIGDITRELYAWSLEGASQP